MAKITLSKLRHSYYPNPSEPSDYALKEIDLDWNDGGAYALLGPSGCGKSTLLNIISGLLVPSEGSILFDGEDVTKLAPDKRNIAQVFQFPVIYDTMTVRQNLEFPLKNRGMAPDAVNARVTEIAQMLGITERLDERASNLSADAKQIISLGRGLVRSDVNAILFDEPLTVIDPHKKWVLRSKLKELHKQFGVTMVYVTHDQTEAMSMADTVVLMKDGHIQQVGPPEDLYNKPNNTFVAEFVGAPPMALIKSEGVDGFGEGQTLGIRAENIQIVPKGEGRLTCTITESEFLGSETLIGLDHGHATGLCVLKSGMDLMPEGDEIDITFNNNSLHVFDAAGHRTAAQG